ncbi:hypothetical protein [Burkholderia cenocepacia]|uniref:hypothetical protein n=1 Tax=Burkholderia cenocepacia TaxID=95486 RepID=UPI0012373B8E|nr:hypothetical protein [Burkholderia cenocepacia]
MKLNILLAALPLLAATIAHADPWCEDGHLGCRAAEGVVFAAGSLVGLADDVKFALSTWTPIHVALDDGTVVFGKLSPRARGNRLIEDGDTLPLRCSPQSRFCELLVGRMDTRNSPYPRNSPLYGKQSSIAFAVMAGVPDKRMLVLDSPLPGFPIKSVSAQPASAPR